MITDLVPTEQEILSWISEDFAESDHKSASEHINGYRPTVVSASDSGAATVSSTPKRSAYTQNDGIVIGSKTLKEIRDDFPILSEKINGNDLVWLDNGATTQRPRAVIDRLSYYYTHENSNVHRGAHELAARSTDAYEGARQIVADFIGAPSKDNIVFIHISF